MLAFLRRLFGLSRREEPQDVEQTPSQTVPPRPTFVGPSPDRPLPRHPEESVDRSDPIAVDEEHFARAEEPVGAAAGRGGSSAGSPQTVWGGGSVPPVSRVSGVPVYPVTRLQITDAATLLADKVLRTDVMEAVLPSGQAIVVKAECQQHAGSFKPRGVFVNVLTCPQRPAELLAASSGNHAAAVAYVAQALHLKATVYVPRGASPLVMQRLEDGGAQVVVVPGDYRDALEACQQVAVMRPETLFVPAFDSPGALIGQGTVGLELESQAPQCDTVVAPIGGGGLMGGLASWCGTGKRLVGVEPVGSAPFHDVLRAGHGRGIGSAVPPVAAGVLGELPWAAMRAAGVRPATVSGAEIEAARRWLWQELRLAAEPAGAAALAAVMAGKAVDGEPQGTVGVVVTGGNCDPGDFR